MKKVLSIILFVVFLGGAICSAFIPEPFTLKDEDVRVTMHRREFHDALLASANLGYALGKNGYTKEEMLLYVADTIRGVKRDEE